MGFKEGDLNHPAFVVCPRCDCRRPLSQCVFEPKTVAWVCVDPEWCKLGKEHNRKLREGR